MSLPVEDQIMRDIGFAQHYNWFNGSYSCEGIRRAAVEQLPAALRKHGLTPSKQLMRTLERIAAEADEERFVLTKTWQACADAIRAHMEHTCTATDAYLRERYLPRSGEVTFIDEYGVVRTRRFGPSRNQL